MLQREKTIPLHNGCTKFTTDENRGNHSAQTKITFSDLGHLKINLNDNEIPVSNYEDSDKTGNLKFYDTNNNDQTFNRTRCDVECDKNEYYYKENLRNEINKWISHVPIYPNSTAEAKTEKENAINSLFERICDLVDEVENPNYEQMVKYEIYQSFDDLKLWYPGAKRDQAMFKEGLCLNLWIAIKDVNDKWLGYKSYNYVQRNRRISCDYNQCSTTTCDDRSLKSTIRSNHICNSKIKRRTKKGDCIPKLNTFKDDIDYEISDWLTKSNLYRPDCSGMTKRTIINIITNRLKPYLNQPVNDRNKTILRTKIIETLEDLPISLNCFSNTGQLTKFADNLANKLLSIQAKFEGNKCRKCIRTSLQCITKESKEIKDNLKPDFLGQLRECLTLVNLDNQKFVEQEILDIISENMGSLRYGDVGDVESDIFILLQESGELTQAEMVTIVKCVIENVKNIVMLDEDNLQITEIKSPLNLCNSAILSVYTSEHELSRAHVSPLVSNKSIKQHPSEESKLNQMPSPQRSLLSTQKCEPCCSLEFFMSETRVSLPDVITTWVNEQPSKIYSNHDIEHRNRKIHELAVNLKPLLQNNASDKDKYVVIAKWLRDALTNEHINKVNALSINLCERLKRVSIDLDETVIAEKKLFSDQEIELKIIQIEQKLNQSTSLHESDFREKDPDETMKELIMKFIQHNSDVDDSIARGAFAELLETEIQKLSAPSRKEMYEGFLQSPQNKFSPMRLDRELKYIKDITDWLKNIPVENTYNAQRNKKRIDFCIHLAGDIAKEESDRVHHDDSNNNKLEAIIGQYMTLLPIHPSQQDNINRMVHQLSNKIISRRQKLAEANEHYALTNPHPNITDFIEEYICINGREIAEDDLKLEACSDRLLKEVKQIACNHDPGAFTTTGVYRRLAEPNPKGDATVKDFDIKLAYAEEISDWMKNLPLVHTMEEGRAHLTKELAEKIAETKRKQASNPNETQVNLELECFIENWISKLPLDRKKEVVTPIVVKQLLQRIERVNKINRSIDNVVQVPKTKCCYSGAAHITYPPISLSQSSMKKMLNPESCFVKLLTGAKEMPRQTNPASWIVKSVEDWTLNLPIEGDDDNEIRTVKTNIAKKLFQKIGELNVNRRFYKDSVLYNDVISDEIDALFENFPQNLTLKENKEKMKKELLQTIAESTRKIHKMTAGKTYKQRLENIIDSSMPNPVQVQDDDPGFDIYKNRLALIFILENFDHGYESSKLKYEKRLKREIDTYFKNAQSRNAIKLTKDELYNELYSVMYKVPLPNQCSLQEEIEEIKIKCDIDDWFEELLLQRPVNISELLEWDKIFSTMAKRLHEMKIDPKPTDNEHKEITKWLSRLPVLPGNDIDELAYILENRLKCRAEERESVLTETRSDSDESKSNIFNNNDFNYNSVDKRQILAKPVKKSAQVTIEMIEDWCNQLPVPDSTFSGKESTLKGDLVTKIIIKVSELNSNPETFNDDLMYSHLLDKELENILSTLPASEDLRRSKETKKYQLIEGLNSIKPLIREERARYEYRNDLNDTINSFFDKLSNKSTEKTALFNNFRDKFVDDFVEYYHVDDDLSKQFFKKKIYKAMTEFLEKIEDDKDSSNVFNDAIIRGNQLLCELSKVPMPNEAAVIDEIQEIRMKKQVANFFDTVLKDINGRTDLRNQVKISLAKRLNEIEKTGHNIENDEKMKREITKSVRKLGHEISSHKIEIFIDKLKLNEVVRKTPLDRKYDSYPVHSNKPDWINSTTISENGQIKKKCCGLPNCKRSRKIQEEIDRSLQQSNTGQQQPKSAGKPGPSDKEKIISGSSPSQSHKSVGNSSSKTQTDDLLQHQVHGEVGQSSFGPPGSTPQSLSPERQKLSYSPANTSGVQWQSKFSSGGPGQLDVSQGLAFPQTSGGLFAPKGLDTSISPYATGQSQQRGSPVVVSQPGQQSFGLSLGNGSQWQSPLASPGPQQGPLEYQAVHQPFLTDYSQRQPQMEIPWQNQNYFGAPGAAVIPRGFSIGRQEQTFEPLGSDAQWQSIYSTGPQQTDYNQGRAQSPGRLVPPQALDFSTSPYAHNPVAQPWQKGAGVQQIGPAIPNTSQWQSQDQRSYEPLGPELGSDAQWQSLFSAGPQQLYIDQGRAESPARLVPPRGLEMSMSPYGVDSQQPIYSEPWQEDLSGGSQQQSFPPASGMDPQWQSLYPSDSPQQIVQSRHQSPGRLLPPRGLETSTSPYANGVYQPGSVQAWLTGVGQPQSPARLLPPRGLDTSASPYSTDRQQSARPNVQWGYHEQYTAPQSSSNLAYDQTQGSIVGSLNESAMGYPGFVNEVPRSSSRQDQFVTLQRPGSMTMLNQSYSPSGGGIRDMLPAEQLPPSSMHPSGGSVQQWDTQSSGPQFLQQRAVAMVHGQRDTMGPRQHDQMYNDPYINQQYGPGDVQSPQRGDGFLASLGQSGVSYQGFQDAGPLSSSVRQRTVPFPGSAIPSQQNRTLIPITRSPQSVPALPSNHGYGSPGSLRLPMEAGTRAIDSTLISPYLASPASAPQIKPGVRPMTIRQDISQANGFMSDEEDCLCERQLKKTRRRPFCAIPLLEYCDSCQEFAPFFRPIRLPGNFY